MEIKSILIIKNNNEHKNTYKKQNTILSIRQKKKSVGGERRQFKKNKPFFRFIPSFFFSIGISTNISDDLF